MKPSEDKSLLCPACMLEMSNSVSPLLEMLLHKYVKLSTSSAFWLLTCTVIGWSSLTDVILVFSVLILRPTVAAVFARLFVIASRDSTESQEEPGSRVTFHLIPNVGSFMALRITKSMVSKKSRSESMQP